LILHKKRAGSEEKLNELQQLLESKLSELKEKAKGLN